MYKYPTARQAVERQLEVARTSLRSKEKAIAAEDKMIRAMVEEIPGLAANVKELEEALELFPVVEEVTNGAD